MEFSSPLHSSYIVTIVVDENKGIHKQAEQA